MSQIVFWRNLQLDGPADALLRCFPETTGMTAETFRICLLPGQVAPDLELWSWDVPDSIVLMTQEVLGEDDPDDQPRRTTHGVVSYTARGSLWQVELLEPSETLEGGAMSLARNRDWLLEG